LRAFGYDMLSEPVRRAAMERARDGNAAALSGKVTLVQETEPDVQAGALMYVPVYRHGLPTETVEQRRAALQGWTYSPYRMTDLVRGALGGWEAKQKERRIRLQVHDGEAVSRETLLYDSQGAEASGPAAPLALLTPVEFAGHRWTLRFTRPAAGAFSAEYGLVWGVLAGGTAISLLLFGLGLSLLGTRASARQMAGELTIDLRESEEKFRSLVTNSYDILYTLTGEGVFTFVSPAWTALLGHPVTEVEGRSFQEFVHPDDLPGCLEFLGRVLATGERQEGVEYRVRHIDGSWRWHTSSAVPGRDRVGQVIGFEGAARDVTERRQAEEALRIQHDLGLTLGSTADLHQALGLILDAAVRMESTDCGGIYLADRNGALDLVAHRGLSPKFVDGAKHFPAEAPQALLAREGKARYNSHEALGAGLGMSVGKEGLRGFAIIPVLDEGRLLAVLNLASHTYSDIPVSARHALETLARQIGSTLARIHSDAVRRESRQNLQTLFDSVEDFLFVLDRSGQILETNAVARKRLGYAEAELAGQDVLMVHPLARRAEAAALISAMLAGECDSCQVPLQARDGALIPVETRVTRGTWSGQPALFGVSRDVTDRERMDGLLRESAREMREAQTIAGFGSYVLEVGTGLFRISKNLEAILGIGPDGPRSLEGWKALLHPEDREAVIRLFEEVVGKGIRFDKEYRIVRPKDGEVRWLHTLGDVSLGPDGNVATVAGTNVDVTERRTARDLIQGVNEELEQRVSRRTASLVEANAELAAFSYSVSHELRTPLRAIDGFSARIARAYGGLLDEEGRRLFEQVRWNAKRMGALIDDLLAFSQAGHSVLRLAKVDMAGAAREAFDLALPDPATRERISFSVGPLPEAEVDAVLLRRVWANLLSNAVKFSAKRERPEIRVEGCALDGESVYSVRDNGAGFDQKFVCQLFGVFHRLHGQNEFEGTGVGLALVRRVVTRHGGRVWAEGEPGRGATFSFSLPSGTLPGTGEPLDRVEG